MSLNMIVLEGALNKLSSQLKYEKGLEIECIQQLAEEIVNPSEGYQNFRNWYEDFVAKFRGQITFNETVNLIKYCELLVSSQTRDKVVAQLQKNLSFEVPEDKEKWKRDLLLVEKNKVAADLLLLTHAQTIDGNDIEGENIAKSRWGNIKKLVTNGYIRKLKVVKLKPARILPEGSLGEVRRGHTFHGKPADLAHIETRSKSEMPIRPYIRQRSKSFDGGSKRFVLRALSLSQPGSPRESDDGDQPDIFDADHDDNESRDVLPPVLKQGTKSSPKKITINTPTKHQYDSQDAISSNDAPSYRSPHRNTESETQHISPPMCTLDGEAMQRRRTAGHTLRGHVAVNLPNVSPPSPMLPAPSTLAPLSLSVSTPTSPANPPHSTYSCPPKSGGVVVMRTKSSELLNAKSPIVSVTSADNTQPVGVHPSSGRKHTQKGLGGASKG